MYNIEAKKRAIHKMLWTGVVNIHLRNGNSFEDALEAADYILAAFKARQNSAFEMHENFWIAAVTAAVRGGRAKAIAVNCADDALVALKSRSTGSEFGIA